MVEPGRRSLGERYELDRLIAAGGMGQVWRGTDTLLGRPVAVKVLRSEYTGDPTFLARFRAEAQHAAALSHPNIAAVFDYGETVAGDTGETLAYLVMELVEGEPLSAALRREGRLDPGTTLSVLEQTAAALAEAHRVGLVHRDVKPGNILVRADGSVKITDFGIAWSAGSVPLTRTGQVIGTPQYISPEQAEGHLATPASDVYALGLVGYECLTGHPAFEGDNPVTIALKQVRQDPEPLPADLPSGLSLLIRRALSKDPSTRMPDGAAFVAAIEALRAGRPLPGEHEEAAGDPATRAVPVPVPALAVPAAAVPAAAIAAPSAAPPPGAALPVAQPAPAGGDAVPAPVTPPHGTPHTVGPPPPRRHRLAAVLVPLVALLLGAGAAGAVFVAVSDPAPSTPAPAADTRDRDSVLIDAQDYIGRPVDEVALQLSSLGLTVLRREEVTAAAVPGMVTAVEPAGVRLEPGDEVTVVFAVAPEEAPSPAGPPAVATGAAVEERTVTAQDEAPASPTTPAAEPTPTEEPQVQTQEEPATSTAPASDATTSAPPSEPPATTTTAPSTATTSSAPPVDEEAGEDGED
ncbi:MAG TPA: protein kinase [Geodermatophilus sp.]|nr:protein kinase [Geodermatophilus sp.]